MAETAFTQTPATLEDAGVLGLDPFANAELPDVANGNKIAYKNGRVLIIRNNNIGGTGYVSCQPIVQKTVPENGEQLAITPVTPIQVAVGETLIIGPYTSNFRKVADSTLNFAFAVSGDTVAADIDIGILDL